jgi:LPS-assembly lipoprotein
LALLALSLVSGCGFRPLYGAGEKGPSAAALAEVAVAPIADRIGQQVRNRLLDRLNPKGRPVRPRYRLEVEIAERRTGIAVESDDTVSRINLTLSASFALHGGAAERPIFTGTTRTIAAYNITRSDYANLIAERDARSRAARTLADEIGTRLAIFFNKNNARKS